MSQQKSGAATTHGEEFPESAISDYLKSHPDFFERHPLILLGLKLPHRTGGSAVSLRYSPNCSNDRSNHGIEPSGQSKCLNLALPFSL